MFKKHFPIEKPNLSGEQRKYVVSFLDKKIRLFEEQAMIAGDIIAREQFERSEIFKNHYQIRRYTIIANESIEILERLYAMRDKVCGYGSELTFDDLPELNALLDKRRYRIRIIDTILNCLSV